MKDEEMAEKYAEDYFRLYCPQDEELRAVKQAFLAGLKARPQWHDLWKDPNDLPNMDTKVLFYCYGRVKQGLFTGFFKSYYGDCKVEEVIAWCEIPTFLSIPCLNSPTNS